VGHDGWELAGSAFSPRGDRLGSDQRKRRIRDPVLILESHPMVGRQVEDARRELVMRRGTEAYLALGRWMPAVDVVIVLAVRSAREAGYQGQ